MRRHTRDLRSLSNKVVIAQWSKLTITVQGETAIGEVIDKGGGKVSQNGETIPMCVSRRDKIEFSKHGMIKTQSEGEDLYLIREDSIICVIMD